MALVSGQEDRVNDFVTREEIIPLLDRPKKVGSWVMSFCPSHVDKVRSLGLSDSGVLECFVSCEFGDVWKALRERGPSVASAPTTGARPSSIHLMHNSIGGNSEWEMVDLYIYTTASGEVVAEKSRWHNLFQKTPDGKPVKKFMWRLPERTAWRGLEGKLTTKDLPLYGEERLNT